MQSTLITHQIYTNYFQAVEWKTPCETITWISTERRQLERAERRQLERAPCFCLSHTYRLFVYLSSTIYLPTYLSFSLQIIN